MQSQWHQKGGQHDRRNIPGTCLAAPERLWEGNHNPEKDPALCNCSLVHLHTRNELADSPGTAKNPGPDTEVVRITEHYPLQWPTGWPRINEQKRKRAAFSYKAYGSQWNKPLTFEVATRHLYGELNRLGAKNIILSSNLKLRADGVPYSRQGRIDDPGIVVYFKYKDADQCIPCDKWDRPEDNIRAIAKTIEAIRGIERWGAKEMVDAAFRGFKALPAPGDVISTYPQYFNDCETDEDCKAKFKRLAKTMHPDSGGTHDQFTELMRQFRQRVK